MEGYLTLFRKHPLISGHADCPSLCPVRMPSFREQLGQGPTFSGDSSGLFTCLSPNRLLVSSGLSQWGSSAAWFSQCASPCSLLFPFWFLNCWFYLQTLLDIISPALFCEGPKIPTKLCTLNISYRKPSLCKCFYHTLEKQNRKFLSEIVCLYFKLLDYFVVSFHFMCSRVKVFS